jgi:hypothetical protein
MNTPQTRRLTILNADEIEAIFGLPQFTEDERQMHFALTPSESEVVSAARTITAAVHLTLQIGYFKAKSQFYVFDLDAVSADLGMVHFQWTLVAGFMNFFGTVICRELGFNARYCLNNNPVRDENCKKKLPCKTYPFSQKT